jgi:hypothetical protein
MYQAVRIRTSETYMLVTGVIILVLTRKKAKKVFLLADSDNNLNMCKTYFSHLFNVYRIRNTYSWAISSGA